MIDDHPRGGAGSCRPADELRIWREFIETAEALRSELAARLQSESALSPGDYAVLLALSEAPRAADALLRARATHRLGAQPPVAPPRPDGAARPDPPRGVRHRQPRRRGGAHRRPAPTRSGARRCRTCAPSASCSSTRSPRSSSSRRARSPARCARGSVHPAPLDTSRNGNARTRLLAAAGRVDPGEAQQVDHLERARGAGRAASAASSAGRPQVRVGVELEQADEHLADDAAADRAEPMPSPSSSASAST